MANNKQQPSIDFFNALGDFFGKLLRADTLSDVFNVMDSESLRFFREILLSVLICQTKTGESLLDVSERRQIIEIFSYVAERVRVEKDILSPSVFSALDDTVRAFDRHILHYVVFLLEQEQKPRVTATTLSASLPYLEAFYDIVRRQSPIIQEMKNDTNQWPLLVELANRIKRVENDIAFENKSLLTIVKER
jgi:hypothetical protein